MRPNTTQQANKENTMKPTNATMRTADIKQPVDLS